MKLSLILSVIALSIATNEASRFTDLGWNGKQSQIQSDAPQTGTYQSSLAKRAAKGPPIRISSSRLSPKPGFVSMSPGFSRPSPRLHFTSMSPGFKSNTKRYLKLIKEKLM